MQTWDVLIVGAGIAGASLAWRLAQTGRRVCVLERESQPGTHSTGRSAAMFMESYGPPGVRALTRASRAFYLAPPPGFADAPLLQPRHALFAALPEQLSALDALQAELAAAGTVLERLDAAALARAAPMLRPGRFGAGLLDTNGYDIDVNTLLQGFLRGARGHGAALRPLGELRSATRQADGHWRVEVADGELLAAPVLVNAAGAWADELAERCGARPVGLQPRRRSAFTFRPPPGTDVSAWPMVASVDEAWYFKPDAGQLLGSPANVDPVPPHDVQPEELDIALAIDRIERATTLAIRRPARTWAGLRSFVADGGLVGGFDDAAPGFFWLAAQGGYGIQTSAAMGEACAALARGLPLPAHIADFGLTPPMLGPRRLHPTG